MDQTVFHSGYFLHRANFSQKHFEFIKLSREKIANQTFLDDKTLGGFLIPSYLSFQEAEKFLTQNKQSLPPARNFIFHTAFCCSTLISKALDSPGKVLSLREPNVLLNLSHYKRLPSFAREKTTPLRPVLETALRFLNKPYTSGEKSLIKPSNVVNNLIPDILDLNPDTKGILLFQNLKDFVLSFLKKGEPGKIFARKLFMTFFKDGTNQDLEFYKNPFSYSDMQVIALLWVVQVHGFRENLKKYPDRLLLVNSQRFLENPDRVLSAISKFLNLGRSEIDFTKIQESHLFKKNSKFPDQVYSFEKRDEENRKLVRENSQSLEFISEWSKPHMANAGVIDLVTSL